MCFLVLINATVNFSFADEYDAFYEDDDLSEFAIVDDVDNDADDMNLDMVTLNPGADVVNVRQFDIAGIMLGMNYDEINNLFFTNGGLYAPRRNNSIVYTINKDLKYNLDDIGGAE